MITADDVRQVACRAAGLILVDWIIELTPQTVAGYDADEARVLEALAELGVDMAGNSLGIDDAQALDLVRRYVRSRQVVLHG